MSLVDLYRDLHQHPELSFQETRTAAIAAERLRAAGFDTTEGVGGTGVVGVLRNGPGPTALLRADMDALPVLEDTGLEYASTARGVDRDGHDVPIAHACGHDVHVSCLVGATAELAAAQETWSGTLLAVFQPAEELATGARAMIDDGLFDRFPVDAVYAMHNWPHLPAGVIGVNNGPMMAAADFVEICIQGRGGHGAHPHLAVDPVLVAGHIITAAQSIVSRNVNPLDSAVVSLCAMRAGDLGASSVIPREVRLSGTVRSFRRDVQDMLEERLARLVDSIAMAFGATASLTYRRHYPATVNTASEAKFAADTAAALVGPEKVVRDLPPSMGSEDFSFMLQTRPGAYLRLGQGNEGGCFLHSSRYDFNDAVLPLGAALFASLVERAMPLTPS